MGLLTLLGIALCVAPAPTRLALALNVPDGGGEAEFFSAMRQQIRLGLDGGVISLKWEEYEEQKGKPLDDAIGGLKFMGQEALVTVASIDTARRRLPADVATKSWDDPDMLRRWSAFLTEISGKFGPAVKWVSLGNEVDGYLSSRPTEVEPYLKFLAEGRAAIRKVRPDILVGVTTMCMDGMKQPDLVRRLQAGMDATVFTYYPLDGFQVLDPDRLAPHILFMEQSAGPRPLLLQEIGYPSSGLCGSSPEKQARFVQAMFSHLDRLAGKVPLAAFFLQVDFSPSMIKALESYYGLGDPRFLAFLSSLGLSDSTGKPKTAWEGFCKEVLKRKPVQAAQNPLADDIAVNVATGWPTRDAELMHH